MGGDSPLTQMGERPGPRRVVRVADLLRLHPRVPVDTARHGASAVPVDSILRREGRTGPMGVVLPTAAGTVHAVPRRRAARVTGALLVAGSALGVATIATQEPSSPGDPARAAAPGADAARPAERERVRVPLAELVPVAAPVPAPPAGPAPGDGWTQVAFPGPAEQGAGAAGPARSGDGGGSAPGTGSVEDLTASALDLVEDTTATAVRVERSTDGPSGRLSSSSSSSVSGEGSASATSVQSSGSGRGGDVPDIDRLTGGLLD